LACRHTSVNQRERSRIHAAVAPPFERALKHAVVGRCREREQAVNDPSQRFNRGALDHVTLAARSWHIAPS